MSRLPSGLDLRGCRLPDGRLRCPVCGREGVGQLYGVAGSRLPHCVRCVAGLKPKTSDHTNDDRPVARQERMAL